MPKTKYPIFKSLHRGEKGFTLIELLIVVAILGVIAAVVALNIGSFMGTGTEEAANTEAHQVQTAVIAYMTHDSLSNFNGTVGPTTSSGPEDYLMNPGLLQADYTVTDAELAEAGLIGNSKWTGCNFTAGQWICS